MQYLCGIFGYLCGAFVLTVLQFNIIRAKIQYFNLKRRFLAVVCSKIDMQNRLFWWRLWRFVTFLPSFAYNLKVKKLFLLTIL